MNPRLLETLYKEHVSAARQLYTIAKAVRLGEQWRAHLLPNAIEKFERTSAALKAEAERK